MWKDLGRLAFTGDVHDLGRVVFTSMNSCTRQTVLNHNDLPCIMTMIQRVSYTNLSTKYTLQYPNTHFKIIDADVQNKDVLRAILYMIVNERCELPGCLRISEGVTRGKGSRDGIVNDCGGFADIYLGTYRNVKVALKRLRGVSTKSEYKKVLVRRIRFHRGFGATDQCLGSLQRSYSMAAVISQEHTSSVWYR